MPINYKDYHPKWKKISLFIRKYRAKNKCEWCGIDNGSLGYRAKDGQWITWEEIDNALNKHGYDYFQDELSHFPATKGPYKIILTVAHIDQDKKNNSFFNLAALCQRCHLNHDRKHHIEKRIANRDKKIGQLLLF